MNSHKNDENTKKFISDDKFLKNNCFTDSLDTENIIKLLKDKPYLLNQPQDKFGLTILYRAVVNKNYNLCEYLLENNADPNIKNVNGETPLHQAIDIENNKIINLLLEKGANPNATTNDGETPMHIACLKGNNKIVKLLLLYGANPYIRTLKTNYSPFDYAAESKQIKVVHLLKPLMETEHSNKPNKIDSIELDRGFNTTKHIDSPKNRLYKNTDLSYVNNSNINNTTKNCKNSLLNTDSLHERTKSTQTYNRNINNIPSNETNSCLDGPKDNISLSFLNQVSMFEAKIEKIKNDLANINNENYKSLSNNSNVNSMKSQDLLHKRYQSNVFHKTNSINTNIYNSYNQGEYFSNVVSPININVDVSKDLQTVMNNHKKNTMSLDNSLYNSIENLYPNFKSNFTKNLKFNQITLTKDPTPASQNTSNISSSNYLNTTVLNKIQKPQHNLTSNLKPKINGNDYTLKATDSRIITLRPDELCDSYEKLQKSLTNEEESRITYNTNFGNQNAEEIFNLPLQQKNYFSQNMMISKQFWNDIEINDSKRSKKSTRVRISEMFYDDQKILAIFSSSANDINTEESNLLNDYNIVGQHKVAKDYIVFKNNFDNLNLNYENKNISLNNSQENIFSEQNITSRRDVKSRAKKNKISNDKNISLALQSSLNNDNITFKNVFKENERIEETDLVVNTENSKEIHNFLSKIHLEKFTKCFTKSGFDDINVILDQMRNGYGLTDENLSDIGIKLPGIRAKILIKLEEDAHLFDFHIPINTYHISSADFIKNDNLDHDTNLKNLKNWLSLIKVETFFPNFIENGYHSLELLIIQMASKNPITDKLLEEDLKIKKIGYRVRILNKLKSDAKLYIDKYKGKEILLHDKNNEISDPCKCIIY